MSLVQIPNSPSSELSAPALICGSGLSFSRFTLGCCSKTACSTGNGNASAVLRGFLPPASLLKTHQHSQHLLHQGQTDPMPYG